MQFNSLEFLIFFPIVVLLYNVIPYALRRYWLLIASYYFYMYWNPQYALLILFTTVATYFTAIIMGKSKRRKIWLVVCLAVNLGLLFVFKYSEFAIQNINAVLSIVGLTGITRKFDLLLPVGISFYTFQTLGYVIDVYRGDIEAEHKFVNYALFVSFFPQLVAGPIERSKNLLGQIDNISNKGNKVAYEKIVSGFSLICFGMFQKVVIADRLAQFVNRGWDNLQMIGLTEGIAVSAAFSLQIYCDFGAYSTIAIGCARIFGISLMENFNTPYLAMSIKDFWRRWHISLSIWFRDYLYIPLGGSRCSKVKKYRNILITFAVSGLWHGANWTYVIWGMLHGVYQIIGDILQPVRNKMELVFGARSDRASYKISKIAGTFILTTFAWIFFRAPSVKDAITFIGHMLTKPNPWALFDGSLYSFGIDKTEYHILIFSLLGLLVVDLIRYYKSEDFGTFLSKQGIVFRWLVLLALIVSALVYGAYGVAFDSTQFIYFQF